MNELRTLGFAELLDHAWKSTRQHLRAILVPFALLLAPALVVVNVSSNYFSLKTLEMGESDPFSLLAVMGIYFVVLLVLMAWMMVIYRAQFLAAIGAEHGEPIPWKRALATYLRPRIWGTDLLACVLIGFGFIACILPGVFLMLMWTLRMPIMLREQRFGFDALSRSWELMKFNPSQQFTRSPLVKALGALVVVVVLSTAVSMAVQLPVTAWTQYVTFRDAASGDVQQLHQTLSRVLWISMPFSVLAGLVQLGVTLYSYFILAALYIDQRRRREGDDIASRLESLIEPHPSPAGSAAPSEPSTEEGESWQGESWTLPPTGDDRE